MYFRGSEHTRNAEIVLIIPYERVCFRDSLLSTILWREKKKNTEPFFCAEDGTNYQEMLLEMTGQKSVPNVFINKTHVGGCDKTMQVKIFDCLSILFRWGEKNVLNFIS